MPLGVGDPGAGDLVQVEAKILKIVEAGAVLGRPFDGGER
jgi:hypothetical protein